MKHSNLELFIGLLATAFLSIGIFLYIVNEPLRIEETQQTILAHQIDEAATLYAENCAICHGAAGEGIGATPPLDGLQSMPYDDLFKTISRGRYNTAMPAWSLDEGGSLSDYQIQELVSMIQNGNWQDIQVRATEMGVVPSLPFSAEPDAEALEAIASLPDGDVLARGVTLYAENCVACHSADGMGSDIAPPLNQAALRALPAEELTRTISSGVPGTLMAGWGNIISEEDIQALVSLIQRWDEIPSGSIPTPETPPIPVTEELLAMGESIYSANCAQCHGPSGQGTPRAPALNVKPLLTNLSCV